MSPRTHPARRLQRTLAGLTAALIGGLTAAGLAAPTYAAELPRGAELLRNAAGASAVGDFNGDGLADLATGRNQIVFGTRTPESLDLTQPLGTKGLQLTGTGLGQIRRLGDVDGDGFDDIGVSAPAALTQYVVYGGAGNADLEVKQGPRVGVINTNSDHVPEALGDWNGDGIDDLLVYRNVGTRGSYGVTGAGTTVNHGVAVIRGGARLTTLSALSASARVQPIVAAATCTALAQYLWTRKSCDTKFEDHGATGDFDGDGKADLWIRANGKNWIVRGRSVTTAIDALNPAESIVVQGYGDIRIAGNLGEGVDIGDVNGDGKADFAVRDDRYDEHAFRIVFGRTGTAPVSLPAAPQLRGAHLRPRPAGDLNGDGRTDLLVTHAPQDRPFVLTDVAARGNAIRAEQGTLLAEVSETAHVESLGDFDGDGLADLVATTADGAVLVRRTTVDVRPPELHVDLDPTSFSTALGTQLRISVNEPATVRFTVKDHTGAVRGAFTRQVSPGAGGVTWKGATDEGQLPPTTPAQPYSLSATARDAAGNETALATAIRFVLQPLAPATLTVDVTVRAPDGQPLTREAYLNWTLACWPADGSPMGQAPFQTKLPGAKTIELGQTGATCRLFPDEFYQREPELTGCAWTVEGYQNGAALPLTRSPHEPAGKAVPTFTTTPGENRVELRSVCTGGVRLGETIAPFSTPNAWQPFNTGIQITGNSARLTPAKAEPSNGWNTLLAATRVIDPANWKYSFTAKASGGNGAAEGLAFSFLPESLPLAAGGPGGALGVGGLGAAGTVVVAFDMNKGPSDPADQFIGISDGTLTAGHLNYAQTADAGLRMRGTAFKVDVVHKNGVLTVSTNGKVRLTRTVALPPRARIAFSASTQPKLYQEHLVSDFTMTRP